MVIRVEDASGTTTLTLFNKEAEQLIGMPLQKILAEIEEVSLLLLNIVRPYSNSYIQN